jgi:hypothetical protein
MPETLPNPLDKSNAQALLDAQTLLDEQAPPRLTTSLQPCAPTESQVRAAENPPRFVALKHRNFRLFWFGNLISLFGTLAQQAAQSWLVRDKLTDNTFLIALVAACGTMPFLVLTL